MKRILAALATSVIGLTAMAAQGETVLAVTQISYDNLNRPVCSTVRMNPSVYSSLPSDACALGATGSFGPDRVTQNTYDSAGQVLEVDQAYGITTANGFPQTLQRAYARYIYSANGMKIQEFDANGNLTAYSYDGFDRLTTLQYPSTTTPGAINAGDFESWVYDANGNKTSWRRRNGKTISYGYDALNRETTRSVSDGSVQTVYTGYDLLGHVLYARYGSTSGTGITNSYDGLGRLTSTTDMNGRAISYQYDTASNRTKLTYPDTNWQPYSYDAANRVTASGLGSGNYSISYDNLGRVTSVARGTNAAAGAVNYGYDAVGRLTSEAQDLAGTNYDVTWNWAFNPANQIMSMTASSTAYDYQETASATVNNTYDGLNRDAGIAALSGGYDANGNLTYDGTRTFTYDVYNHLLTATGNGANLNLVYDPLGRLAKYSTDGGSTFTTFLYDGTNLISEYDTSGNVSQRYVFGPGTDQPIIWFQGAQNTNPLYFVQDYHGSVIGYADASGNLQDVYKYGPYGEPKNAGNSTSFAGARFRYTGQTVIPEAQLYYYKARVYDPIFGRFLQTDPIGSKDDLDLYAYTAGDPIDGSDPTGLAGGAGATAAEEEAAMIAEARSSAIQEALARGESQEQALQAGEAAAAAKGRSFDDAATDATAGNAGNGGYSNGAYQNVDPITGFFNELFGHNADGTDGVEPAPPSSDNNSNHANDRMAQQGVDQSRVDEALQIGRTIPGNTPDTTVYEVPSSQSASGRGIRVVVNNATGRIVTVMDKGTRYR